MRPVVLVFAAPLAAAAFLFARLAPDVNGKPLFEDEAVAGLIAARPLGEVLETVMADRGGAPLHFVLAHLAFAIDPSPAALRWLSVVFALATVALCYDLGRRLSGQAAGVTAAVVAATSSMLSIYGSFGRMYALFALVGALAADLYLRALQQRTASAAVAAAASAWLLAATHPYGVIAVAAEAAIGAFLWRGRPLRAGLPVAAIGLAMLPFTLADALLAERFAVGLDGGAPLATRGNAWAQLARALAGFAGGEGPMLVVFIAMAVSGLVLVARRQPAFAAFACLALTVPLVLFVLLRTGSAPILSPRHLIFALPLWAALIGAAVARAVRDFGSGAQVLCLAAVAAAAALAPSGGIQDPRDAHFLGGGSPTSAPGAREALAAPSAWLRRAVGEHDVLFPYSPVFLAALPATREAVSLPRAEARLILKAMRRVEMPVQSLFVAVPLGETDFRFDNLRTRLENHYRARLFRSWLLIQARGPFPDTDAVLRAAFRALAAARASAVGNIPNDVKGYFFNNLRALCGALRLLGDLSDARERLVGRAACQREAAR